MERRLLTRVQYLFRIHFVVSLRIYCLKSVLKGTWASSTSLCPQGGHLHMVQFKFVEVTLVNDIIQILAAQHYDLLSVYSNACSPPKI